MRLKLLLILILSLFLISCSLDGENQSGKASFSNFDDFNKEKIIDRNIEDRPVNKDISVKDKTTNLNDNLVEDYNVEINEEEIAVTDFASFEVSGIHNGDYLSSTKLLVTLNELGDFKIKYREIEPSMGEIKELEIFAQDSVILTDLKSSTTYNVEVEFCNFKGCYSLGSKLGSTNEEYWQVQGDDSCVDEIDCLESATIVLEDSATAAVAIKYPDEDITTLYTKRNYPDPDSYPTKSWGRNNPSTNEFNIEDYLKFEWADDYYISACEGIERDCSEIEMGVATYQPIPLANEEKVTLFFEGITTEKTGVVLDDGHEVINENVQLYKIDSVDGYNGLDFNSDSESGICSFDDLVEGGNCNYELVIAADEDSGLKKVMQSKIAYPVLDSVYWDTNSDSSFITITGGDSCGTTDDGIFFARFRSGGWEVKKDEDGCAIPLFHEAHGPVVTHLGETRYKLYAETKPELYEEGDIKPFRVIYADGSLFESEEVDFEDFEKESLAREVNFVWPNGKVVSGGSETGFADHFIFLPDSNLENQIMFMNIGGRDNVVYPGISRGIGVAYLLNS